MDLWELALGFMDAQVLFTAEDLGVFEYLEAEPRSLEVLAAHTGLPQRSALRLVTMLCALELIHKQPDGRFANSAQVSEQLVRGKPAYIGSMFRHVREQLYPTWQYFKDALFEEQAQTDRMCAGQEVEPAAITSDPEALRTFMEGMHSISYESAVELAEQARAELSGVRKLVDIGGASGAFVIALAEHYPALKGIVFDLPQVQTIAEDFIRAAGVAERVSFIPGDFFYDPVPADADAYAMGFILHDWPTEQGSLLLRRVARVAQPGKLLLVGEYLLNDARTGPRHVARMDLNMLVAAQGQERSAAEYRDWLAAYGFALQTIYPTSRDHCFMVFQRV